ncbi:MAG: hypothetical protein QM582_18855 [Micropruina sp.]|uniref:hypothetical protein n=1 Tax=Micropruina sp. TaxID=2737536 RepID=UPI0039E696D3
MHNVLQYHRNNTEEHTPMRKPPALSRLLVAALTVVAITPAATGVAHSATPAYPHIWAPTAHAFQTLPDYAPVDANSRSIVQNVKQYGIEQYGVPARDLPSMNLATHQYSNPLWKAKNSDPTYDIQFSDCQHKGYLPSVFQDLKGVHIPEKAVPSEGSDGQIVVFNVDSGRYVELWQSFKLHDKWFACWGSSITNSYESEGIFPSPKGVSASGAALEPYTVKVEELKAGRIDHAIGIAVPPEVIDTHISRPATRTDGLQPRTVKTLSLGQYLRLPASLDVDSLNLHPVAKAIAKAAQKYGFMVMDGSGGINISLENAATFATDPYPELFGNADNYNVMWGGRSRQYDPFPFDKLQALSRNYVPSADVLIEVTDERDDSFGFRAHGAPDGARMVITWWRDKQDQFTTVRTMDWWSGKQIGYRDAQAKVIDSEGNTLGMSSIVKRS